MGGVRWPKLQMGTADWYRRSTWSEADQADFRKRLNRARPSSRVQYLRIQAHHLAESGLANAAPARLCEGLSRHADDRLQKAPALLQLAECLAATGRWSEAAHAFRAATQQEADFPGVRVGARVAYAWHVVVCERTDLYDDMLRMLSIGTEDGSSASLFPISRDTLNACRAILTAAAGDPVAAKACAREALAAAAATRTELRYHRQLGLVTNPPSSIQERLRALAG